MSADKPLPGPTADEATRLNQASWDERAALHGQDSFYDTAALLAGASSLQQPELDLVSDVDRAALLHLQCHFGLDTLSWARLGARVTGVDFSATAVEKARALASRAELDVEFVHADVLNLPENLYGRFDVAVATYGIFTWIGDLQAWADNAAATLRPGGRLVVVDLHPLAQMIETLEPLVVDFPYTDDEPHTPVAATPATPPPTSPWPRVTVQWAHSVSELVTAFARA